MTNDEESVYLKIRDSLQVITDLEVEQLRLTQLFSMLGDPNSAAAAAKMLGPQVVEAPAPVVLDGDPTEADFEAAFLHSLVPVALADGRGAFVDCNLRFTELSGYTRADLRRRTVFSLVRPDSLDTVVATFKLLLSRDADRTAVFALDAVTKPAADGKRRALPLAVSLVCCSKDHPPDTATHLCFSVRPHAVGQS